MSGLVATKYLLNLNMDPIVLEVKQGIGGVQSETFFSTRLQTPRHEYEFSDFPWPNHVTHKHPTHSEVMDYFQSYAMHFGLLEHIHFKFIEMEVRYIGQECCEKKLEHVGLWSKNGGPYADSAVWDVGVQKSNAESIEVKKEKSINQQVCLLGFFLRSPTIDFLFGDLNTSTMIRHIDCSYVQGFKCL